MQIDIAREIIFKNALHIRYDFHLARMGWTHHIMKEHCFAAFVGYFFDRVCNQLKKWICSWMKNSCEMRGEYLVFKLIFKTFLNLRQTKSNLGTIFIKNVENFVTKHVEAHETYFCFI